MLRKLKELVYMNRYPQISASELEALREDTDEVMLLPSSNDYGWFTSFNSGESYIINAEVITLGRARYANIKYCNGPFISSNNHIIETKNKNQLRARYLYNFLSYTSKTYYVESTSYPKFEKDIFENTTLDVPEISVQDARIKELDLLNNAIFDEKRRLSEFDSLIKSRFNEMFGDCDLLDQKEKWVKLDDVTTIYTGTTPSTANSENWGGDILWVTPAEIKDDDFIISTTERTITEVGRRSKSLEIMPRDTVLLSTRAPIGKVAIAGNPMTCNQGFKNFLCGDRLNNVYLYYLLRYNNEFLNSIGTGTTFKEVSRSKIANVKIPVPPIDLQNVFACFAEKVDKLKFITL